MNDFCLHESEEMEIWLYYEEIFIKHLLCAIQFGIWAFRGGEFDFLQFREASWEWRAIRVGRVGYAKAAWHRGGENERRWSEHWRMTEIGGKRERFQLLL